MVKMVYKNSANRYDQYSVRVNLDATINDYIKLSYGNIGRMEYRQYPTKVPGIYFQHLQEVSQRYRLIYFQENRVLILNMVITR